jgi:hypothetical protein
MTRPKRMDARRARSAGDKTLMAALYEFTNLRELVGRGGGLVQRPAPSGEQHEAAANAIVECLVFEATRRRYAQTGFFSPRQCGVPLMAHCLRSDFPSGVIGTWVSSRQE